MAGDAILAEPTRSELDPADLFFAGVRQPLTRSEVMTAGDVSGLLRHLLSALYELAGTQELPAHTFGRTWRFLRCRIEQVLAS